MRPRRLGALLLTTTLASAPSGAITVYRCVENGSVAYRQNASDPSCEALDIQSEEPDAEAVTRQREALDQNRERRTKARESRRQRMTPKGQTGRAAARENRAAEQDADSALPPIPRELDFDQPSRRPSSPEP